MRKTVSVAVAAAFGFAVSGLVPQVSVGLWEVLGVNSAVKTEPTAMAATADNAHGDGDGHGHGDEHADEEGVIHLTDDQVTAAGISVGQVSAGTLSRTVSVPGTVSANAERLAHVAAKVPGTISAISKNLGDWVKPGEIVALVESREIAEAKSEYLAAMRADQLAQTVYQREKTLWDKRISPQQDFLEAQAALETARIRLDLARQKLVALGLQDSEVNGLPKQPIKDLRIQEIRAQISGQVIERKGVLGETVDANADILVVADLSTLWVQIDVPPTDIPFVQKGQKVFFSSSNGDKAEGMVSFLSPVIDQETRSARAVAVLPNPDQHWRPGSYVTARIETDVQPAQMVAPREAIQTIGGEAVVFVRTSEGFEKREVVLGRTDDKVAEIVFGLDAGEMIAVGNSFVLKAELGKSEAEHSHSH